MGSGDDVGDLAGGEWRRRGRFGGCRMEMTSDTWRLGSGDEVGEWRRRWRLGGCGMEMTLDPQRLGSGDNNSELSAVECRLGGWGM